jgi:GNAT superfamily N-acetyltransferase
MNQARISIQPAEKGDAAAIARIHVRAWRETYQHLLPAELLASLSESQRTDMWTRILGGKNADKGHVLGAWMDGELAGFVCGGRPRGAVENADSELQAIYVLQAAQKQHVGRELFLALTSRLVTDGCRRMFLWVLKGNPAAGFYERMGGRPGPAQETNIGGRQYTELSYVFELDETGP